MAARKSPEMENQEINKLVAEKVMGWKLGKQVFEYKGLGLVITGSDMEFWNPSTNISDAWEVVEKIWNERKIWLAVSPYGDRYASYELGAAIGGIRLGWQRRVRADSAPKAICLASLKSVGVEVK